MRLQICPAQTVCRKFCIKIAPHICRNYCILHGNMPQILCIRYFIRSEKIFTPAYMPELT